MSTFKFTQAEQLLVAEIKRRVSAFKIGSNEPVDNKYMMVLLCAPSYAKSLIKKGIIVPYSHERAGAAGWYNLTDKGKQILKF